MTRSTFPILLGGREGQELVAQGCPRSLPWSVVAPYEERAQLNHDQSLERLAERGGLGPSELVSLFLNEKLDFKRTDLEALPQLLEILSEKS